MKRPPWDEHFMQIAELASKRSTCLSRKIGAVLVRDRRILATGYNGPPSGIEHCDERGGCLRRQLDVPSGQRHEICRAVHAEQNLIAQSSKYGAIVYVTHQPCFICTKILMSAGIAEIHYKHGYPDELSLEMLEEKGVRVVRHD